MNKGKTIFSQIMSLIPERDFKTCVDRYKGNYRARNFSCKDQFLVMSYAQLTGRDSLRDIENCLTALSSKLYHCGISYAVPRNTLAKANEKRDWHIYKDFADVLLKKVRPLYVKDKFRLDLDNMVYAFDSSTISLCLKLCPWAKYRKNKGGIKMHTLVDLRGNLPVSVYLTSASVNDVKALDDLYIEPSAIYLMDRGYVDFNRLFKLITKKNAFFVTRAKDNMLFEVVSEAEVDKSTGIISDERIKLTGLHTAKWYPEELRMVTYEDYATSKVYRFLTNNMEYEALTISELYRERWNVELYFYDKNNIMRSEWKSIIEDQNFRRMLLRSTSHNDNYFFRPLSQSLRFILFSQDLSVSRLGVRSVYAFSNASRFALESARA